MAFPRSEIEEKRIARLEQKGFLPPRAVSGARIPEDRSNPTPGEGEVLVHTAFFERGLRVPAH